MTIRTNILSTAELPEAALADLAAAGCTIDVIPFIHTTAVKDEDTAHRIRQLAAQRATVIFTSINAVNAVTAQLRSVPDWNVYTISGVTQSTTAAFFGPQRIAGAATNGAALAAQLIGDKIQHPVFFCGDKRLDVLPALLLEEGIPLTELTVYTTTLTPVQLRRTYEAILFFSPSAASSFFAKNEAAEATLFAIGATTAASLATHSTNPIVTAGLPSKEEVVKAVIRHFT